MQSACALQVVTFLALLLYLCMSPFHPSKILPSLHSRLSSLHAAPACLAQVWNVHGQKAGAKCRVQDGCKYLEIGPEAKGGSVHQHDMQRYNCRGLIE